MDIRIVFLIFVIMIIVAIFSYVIIKEKSIQFVKQNSISLNKLMEINKKYRFYTLAKNFDNSHTYDNENFYDTISCEDFLIYQLQFKKYDIEQAIKCIEKNKEIFSLYTQEIREINTFGNYLIKAKTLNNKYLLRLEKKFFQEQTLKPKINFSIYIGLHCSTINGRIYRSKNKTFSSQQIMGFIKRLNNRDGYFYRDKEIWDAICRVERGKVSNKMRFSIYQRDGYRCRWCGAKGSLEIDHIKPIAKGGKSTYDNLQTLCTRCNKYKGANY